jgi:hypothetical protein
VCDFMTSLRLTSNLTRQSVAGFAGRYEVRFSPSQAALVRARRHASAAVIAMSTSAAG